MIEKYLKIFICFAIFSVVCSLQAELGKDQSLAQFYHTKNGEMIMNSDTFTEGIRTFLQEENRFVLSLVIDRYDYLFEIGCGLSERALDIVRFGKQFYGIDINANFVSKSNAFFMEKKIEKRARADLFSALNLNPCTFPIAKDKKTLIFFPFNILGNLDDFHLVLANMLDIKQDFCFSVYRINEFTKKSRSEYYTNCGCQHIRYSTTPTSDLFSSQDGLHSAAFKIGYVMELLDNLLESKSKKAKIQVHHLTEVAFMVYLYDIADSEGPKG